jgi:tRNA-splicing ligase RtcB (3'-phosphate/5'-hydroxy nucleic acid ligase)
MGFEEVYGARVPIRMWTAPDDVEPQALAQLRNIANLPWVHGLAVMPDVHLGKGATVGSVIAMRQAVSPAAVGVDIGCGMTAVRTSLVEADLPDDLAGLRRRIEDAVPVGFAAHDRPVNPSRIHGLGGGWDAFWAGFNQLHPGVAHLRGRAESQLGTLGGGNHFIEICVEQGRSGDAQREDRSLRGPQSQAKGGDAQREDRSLRGPQSQAKGGDAQREDRSLRGPQSQAKGGDAGRVWIMLHSGSRNVGKELAERHMAVARSLPHNADLPDRDLAVFVAGTPEMDAYRRDLFWAQDYARRNRAVMLALVQQAVRASLPAAAVRFDEPISCHHNYVAEETYDGVDVLVTRKGAIRAGSGELGIIPGSMGTGSYIVRGLGNPAAYCSASHGAGRRMSRHAAKRAFTVDDLAAQTAGVECRKDGGVLDEIPGAYKDIEQVIADQADLVEVVAHLKQVVCVKG